jgi:hypothetical protein
LHETLASPKRDLEEKRFADAENGKKKTTETLKGITSDKLKKKFFYFEGD